MDIPASKKEDEESSKWRHDMPSIWHDLGVCSGVPGFWYLAMLRKSDRIIIFARQYPLELYWLT